jgi:DNA-binding ferritin-like protein (Dps family)
MTMQFPPIAGVAGRRPHAGVAGMPVDFHLALDAFAAYLNRRVPTVPATAAAGVLDDLVILFAQAADDGILLRAVVGTDPADVAEALLANHADVSCNASARADLTRAIDAVAG